MILEIETSSPAVGRNGGDVSDVTISYASDMRKSSVSNRGRGRG